MATGLGVKQAGLYWYFFELEQRGDALTITKGLICGTVVKPVDALSAMVDMHTSWPKLMSENALAGITGAAAKSASGCSGLCVTARLRRST